MTHPAVASHPGLPRPAPRLSYARHGKRLFDLVLLLLGAPLAVPLICLLCALARLDGGPALFAHRRVGRDGRPFLCLKIRTMVPDAQARLAERLRTDPAAAAEWAARRKLAHDPRITRLGHLLRRSGLDELPQLWNVARGEMSLVGPRPVTAEELSRYGRHRDAYLSLRPGLTGPWQVTGRRDGCYTRRVLLDRRYAATLGPLTDLRLVLRTVAELPRLTGC